MTSEELHPLFISNNLYGALQGGLKSVCKDQLLMKIKDKKHQVISIKQHEKKTAQVGT